MPSSSWRLFGLLWSKEASESIFPPLALVSRITISRFRFLSSGVRKGFAVLIVAEIPWLSTILNWLVLIAGILLIFLVLIQRGKGGGLAGAFGGAGGSSAFGSRAGDLFTRVTLILAAVWVVLIMVQIKVVQSSKATSAATTFLEPGGK
jgi:preprotein translocase subunit SecG